MIDHRFTRFLRDAALMAMGIVLLLGIVGKKAQAGPPPFPLTCTVSGSPAAPVHGTVPFSYTVTASGYDERNPMLFVAVYSSSNWGVAKGYFAFPPNDYIDSHTFNVANYADGAYSWDALIYDAVWLSALSNVVGQYISP